MQKKKSVIEANCIYRFCGNGQGIAGLPHEVTAAQASELGLLEHLAAALQRGDYKPIIAVANATGEDPKGE